MACGRDRASAIGAAAMLVAATPARGSGRRRPRSRFLPASGRSRRPRSHSRVTMAVGDAPDAIAARGREAWVADAADGVVQSVSEAREGGPRVHVGGTPGAIAFDGRRRVGSGFRRRSRRMGRHGDPTCRAKAVGRKRAWHLGPRPGNAVGRQRHRLGACAPDATAAMRPVDGQLRFRLGHSRRLSPSTGAMPGC